MFFLADQYQIVAMDQLVSPAMPKAACDVFGTMPGYFACVLGIIGSQPTTDFMAALIKNDDQITLRKAAIDALTPAGRSELPLSNARAAP